MCSTRLTPCSLSNAAIEAINGILQMAERIARGFRNFHYFRIAAYLKASRLNLEVPYPLPLETSKTQIIS